MKISPTFINMAQKELLERICIRADMDTGVAEFLSNELFNIDDKSSRRRFMYVALQGVKNGLWSVSYSHKDEQGLQTCKFKPLIRIVSYVQQKVEI